MQLAKLLRRKVVVLGPKLLDGDALHTVTLVGVDAAGIWIESDEAAEWIAQRFHVKPATPSAFFIPYTQITTIIASEEALAEAAVEVREDAA